MKNLVGTAAISVLLTIPAFAEKLVDPATVPPEYRETAEKRRAEQVKQRNCALKADLAKVTIRDRAAFVVKCMDADASR